MSKTIVRVGVFFIIGLACSVGVAEAAVTELHVRPDGSVVATNVVVMQKAGRNFFGRLTWKENAFARIVVLAHDATVIKKKHGETAGALDIQVGDVIDVEGKLNGAENSFVINASTIRDHSLLMEAKTLSGAVKSVDVAGQSFVLPATGLGEVKVTVTIDTEIKKGERWIKLADMAAGDRILSAVGTYSYEKGTLAADRIEVHQDKGIFAPRNFQGALKTIAGTVLPTTLTVTVSGTDYTVYLPANAAILNNAKQATSLSRFVVGDIVRFYGTIRKTDLTQIDAEVVRDTNF